MNGLLLIFIVAFGNVNITFALADIGFMENKALELAANELEVSKDELVAEPIQNSFFKSWEFWRVSDSSLPPQFMIIAVDESSSHKILMGDGFSNLTNKEPVKLESITQAKEYLNFFFAMADPMVEIISSIDDIPGVSAAMRDIWKKQIKKPIIGKKDQLQYSAVLWLYKQGKLLWAQADIQNDGSIKLKVEVAEEDIGVAITLD